jgi:hypothetical protein
VVIVAAPGPSLIPDVAEACRGHRVLAVGDAWQRIPWADVLYHCDARYWKAHKGCLGFAGEKWSAHDSRVSPKLEAAETYGLRLVAGKVAAGFSLSPATIHFGSTSGFQGVNLALLLGGNPIVLVGFDMRGREHFKGCDHPKELQNRVGCLSRYASVFDQAATLLPPEIKVLNATPGSSIKGFPTVKLEEIAAWR